MAAPWEKTNSLVMAEDRANRKAIEAARSRANPTWAQTSLTSREARLQQRDKEDASKYAYSTPWQLKETNILDDFDKQVSALEYNLKAPWQEDPLNTAPTNPQVENYKYETMWEPVHLSQKKVEQIANYEYNPPYRCEFNGIAEKHARNKKMIGGHNKSTIAPWQHGSQPGPPVPKNVFERPATSLWERPKQDPAQTAIESSGDPILDSLRAQLKARGASGICGLAKKFKIMDDDESGSLSFDEFAKAMKECDISDLSKKAIAHLFRYFGTVVIVKL
jgi:hypothetical protein